MAPNHGEKVSVHQLVKVPCPGSVRAMSVIAPRTSSVRPTIERTTSGVSRLLRALFGRARDGRVAGVFRAVVRPAATSARASTVSSSGPIASDRGCRTIVADGSTSTARRPPTSTSTSTATPMRDRDPGPHRAAGAGPTIGTRGELRRGMAMTRVWVSVDVDRLGRLASRYRPLRRSLRSRASAGRGAAALDTVRGPRTTDTDGWTGRPAAAASARAEASAQMISICLPRSVASRASSRKLIRDVARREPYGSTSATRSSRRRGSVPPPR